MFHIASKTPIGLAPRQALLVYGIRVLVMLGVGLAGMVVVGVILCVIAWPLLAVPLGYATLVWFVGQRSAWVMAPITAVLVLVFVAGMSMPEQAKWKLQDLCMRVIEHPAHKDSLMDDAHRIRCLGIVIDKEREDLARLTAELSSHRERMAAINALLAEDDLTVPANILDEDVSVRALRNLFHEVSSLPDGPDKLRKLENAKRELRLRLESSLDQLIQASRLTGKMIDTRRSSIEKKLEDLQILQMELQRRLYRDPASN